MRKLWDRNWNRWKDVNAYLFKASYNDNPDVEFQVDPSIGYYASLEASTWLAEMYGRIPKIFRGCVREFWILPGNNYRLRRQFQPPNKNRNSIFNFIEYT